MEGCDSTASSPMVIHRPIPEEVSVKAFKKVLEGPTPREKEDEEARKKKLQGSQFEGTPKAKPPISPTSNYQ